MPYTTIDNIEFSDKKVVIRLDLNVPIKNAQVQDKTRIDRVIPTLKAIISKKPRYIVILSHLGRPKPQPPNLWNADNSLEPLIPVLKKTLNLPVIFTKKAIGEGLYQELNSVPAHSIILIENVRFYEGEEENSQDFSKALSKLGDIYVNDAFSCCHRAHASVVGITQHLPSYAGSNLDRELQALKQVLTSPKRPIIGIVAGSKVSTKIDLLLNLIDKLDYLFVSGGIANTFLHALGHNVGKSLIEKDCLEIARIILDKFQKSKCKLEFPIDAIVASELSLNVQTQALDIEMIENSQAIYDIGPKTVEKLKNILSSCQTVLWNGPLGVYEIPPFEKGSKALSKIIAELTETNKIISIMGGGDTIAAIAEDISSFTYVSTAGGAFLEWLEGKILPGVEALNR